MAYPILGMDFFMSPTCSYPPLSTRSCLPRPWTPSSSQVTPQCPPPPDLLQLRLVIHRGSRPASQPTVQQVDLTTLPSQVDLLQKEFLSLFSAGNSTDVSTTGTFRPVVPSSFRQKVFDMIHGIAHPGMWASRHLILSRFVWKCVASHVAAMAWAYLTCQQGKVHGYIHVQP